MITKEQLDTANEMIKKIPFKGKGYALVASRVSAFRAICPRGRITTEIVSMENGIVTMKSTIWDDDDRELSTGYAQEKEETGYVNKTSYIENCETSAIGRALGFLGIGSDENISSAEELANAVLNQNDDNKQRKSSSQKKPASKEDRSDAEKNQEMIDNVNPDLLPDNTRTQEYRIEKLKAEGVRTGKNEATILKTAGVNSWEEITDAKFVSLMGLFSRL